MDERQKTKLSQFFGLSAGLFIIWILLSGKFEAKFILAGIISSMLVAYVCIPILTLKKGEDGEKYFMLRTKLIPFLKYVIWLIAEIIKASIDVTKVILKPKEEINSKLVYFVMNYKNPVASVLLSNSIIMTPGTITLDVSEEGVFKVHALTEKIGEDLLSGKMPKKVAELYEETCEFIPLRMEDCVMSGEDI